MEENKTQPKYQVSDKVGEQLAKAFTYHPPKVDQQERYVALRDQAHQLALSIALLTPPSREQSLALTNLEQAVMWANAAIARGE